MSKPHKHAEVIKQWADGRQIEYLHESDKTGRWVACGAAPEWNSYTQYRVKPERVWPVTSMTDTELIYATSWKHYVSITEKDRDNFRAIANAAIRRHIEDTESPEHE